MKKNPAIDRTLLIRNKALPSGRSAIVSPQNSCMKYLSYGRILLDEKVRSVEIETLDQEFNFIVIQGHAIIEVNGDSCRLERYDSLYVPRNATVQFRSGSSADIVECSAPVSQASTAEIVRFRDLQDKPPLHMKIGQEGYSREVFQFVGPQVNAFRLLTGITFGKPGNWTGFPPHRHEQSREEIYLYVDLPEPGFGVQFVYDTPEHIEFAEIVHENDAVLLPTGYHPNVAAPGFGLNYIWMMAAFEEVKDREWADMEWQPGLREYYG